MQLQKIVIIPSISPSKFVYSCIYTCSCMKWVISQSRLNVCCSLDFHQKILSSSLWPYQIWKESLALTLPPSQPTFHYLLNNFAALSWFENIACYYFPIKIWIARGQNNTFFYIYALLIWPFFYGLGLKKTPLFLQKKIYKVRLNLFCL